MAAIGIEFDHVVDAVEAAEPLGEVSPGTLASSVWRAVRGNARLLGSARELGAEAGRIVAGRSTVCPEPTDWRFRDPSWQGNPIYHRLMQLYLAWSATVVGAADHAELGWRDAERARFFLNMLTSTVAPTNMLLGNPAALKHAFDTGGRSLARGARNLARDVRRNGGMPTQADRRPFRVGHEVAATPGAVIYRDEVCELLQFTPTTPDVRLRPVIMVTPQINKYYFMDLAPGRSFAEYAVSRGLQFFAISWRNPGPGQGHWDMDTYAESALRAIDAAREITGSDDVNLLGLCAGGILASTILSHLAAEDDGRVHTASFGVTLLDFEIPSMVGLFDARPLISVARWHSRRSGVLDGAGLASVFSWLRPNDLIWNYWVNNYLLGKDPPAFDVLAWNADHTNLPGALHAQFLDIFHNNVLVRGAMTVLGTPVDLSRITIETYVTGAVTDHLTPWRGCYRTTQLLPGPTTFVLSNAGHIQSLVNPPGNLRSHYFVGPEPGPDADEWRANATLRQGTWWEHWAEWVLERSGKSRPAPSKLGSRLHPAIEPAPGSYVVTAPGDGAAAANGAHPRPVPKRRATGTAAPKKAGLARSAKGRGSQPARKRSSA